jgi:hypothetical protein
VASEQPTQAIDGHGEIQILRTLQFALQNSDTLPVAVQQRAAAVSWV